MPAQGVAVPARGGGAGAVAEPAVPALELAVPARERRCGAAGGAGAGAGGAGGGSQVSAALTKALKSDASKYRWVAATSGSQTAATLELATGGDP